MHRPAQCTTRHHSAQIDWLLGRMVRDGVRFSHQAVGRLTSFCFGRSQPRAAYLLFKARQGVGWGGGGCCVWGEGGLAEQGWRASLLPGMVLTVPDALMEQPHPLLACRRCVRWGC